MSTGAVSRFSLPTELIYGINTTSLLGSEIKKLGGKKALFATDAGLSASGILEKVYQVLKNSGIPFVLYDKVPVDPTDKDIDAMAAIAKQEGCNCIIGAGGGSVIVACKGAALVANNEGKMLDYVEGEDKYPNPSLLCVIMPTNAGTGAEVSKGTTITDSRTKKKARILGYRHAVRLAILDPTLLMTVPRNQSVASGVDALTHAIEAYLSEKANPISDCVALKSIEMMMTNFTQSVFTINLEPKGQMLLGSTMANIAVSNSTIGLSHILNGVITHIYETRGLEPMSYGMIHAVLLPPTLEFNMVACEDKTADLAKAMGVTPQNKSAWEIRKGIMERLDNLLTDLGAPRKLIWHGLSAEDIVETGVKMGTLSLDRSKQGANVIRKYNGDDLLAILRQALP